MGKGAKVPALVEMIMVMTLLALLGITICTLIVSGAEAQKRVISDKDAHMDALVALSYINVKLRQNDAYGKISVEELELNGENAVVIKERGDSYQYDTWLFCYDGKLLECLVEPGGQPSELLSFRITDIARLETEMNGGVITSTVYYYYGGELRDMSASVFLRSR